MNDFLNPYIAGAPVVEPSMFFGRQDIFDWIEQNLSGRFVNHILVIHGQRRVGKTSVLKQIPNHLPSHFIFVFFDLQGRTHTGLDRFQWWLAREICRAVNQVTGNSIAVPEREQFTQDGEFLVTNFMPEVISALGESVLLLTFDEFDTLSVPDIQESLTKPLINYLRHMFDLPSLTFIFSIGSSGHKLENMQASYTEFFKTALYRKISFLKLEDCSKLITQPVQGVLEYQLEAVERIYKITSGHPYFTQLICHELFSLSQKTGRRIINKEDVESVLEDVIERGTVNLKFVWDEASDLEKWILSSLAHELQVQEQYQQMHGIQDRPACNDHQLATVLYHQHVRCSENDLNSSLVHLREKDVLTQDNHFVVELLCIWLLKNRPLDRVREELLKVNPIANRYNEIGDEFRQLGQLDKAMDSYHQALTTDPSNLRAQVSIATLYLETKDYQQAVDGYEAALRLDDDDVAARSGLCTGLLALGEGAATAEKPEEAIGYYQRILVINPDHPEAHQRLATIYSNQAEQALVGEDAEIALGNYADALKHAPDDEQLAARYAQAKEKHTKQLIDELIAQSEQALAVQDWNTALDATQRALQLAPDDPILLDHSAKVRDAPRLAQISTLRAHAIEMERLEHWKEAIQDWKACLELKPEAEQIIQQSLEHAQLRSKIALNYTQAQEAIKTGRYSQAISLLQAVIAQDASYKDAAELLVTCLKVRPKRAIKLPQIPKFPIRWLRWALPFLFIMIVLVVGATQWSQLQPFLSHILPAKIPEVTQAAMSGLSSTSPPGASPSLPSMAGVAQELMTFTGAIQKMVSGKSADMQLDFSGDSLPEYLRADPGFQNGILQDGVFLLGNEDLVGKETINDINYMLLVDLRFDQLSGKENFFYNLRQTSDPYQFYATGYQFLIVPSTGDWALAAVTDFGGQSSTLQTGNLGMIDQGSWYKLGVIVQNDSLWMYWQDQLILTHSNLTLYGSVNCFGLDPGSVQNATLDIDNFYIWHLGTQDWMRNDWIIPDIASFWSDSFTGGEGWQFSTDGNSKYENGKVILQTDGGETFFSQENFTGTDVAMEVTFMSVNMPDTASLVWYLAHDKTTGAMIGFEYFPANGSWIIYETDNQETRELLTGWTQTTPPGNGSAIMVVFNAGRVSAFQNNAFLGSVLSDLTAAGKAGKTNAFSLRGNEGASAEIEISHIGLWNLDPFAQAKMSLVGKKDADVQDDFSADTLQEYWTNEEGALNASLIDGAMRIGSNHIIGTQTLRVINYILQVDLRFDNLSGDEDFTYWIRMTSVAENVFSGYRFYIVPTTGEWSVEEYLNSADKYTNIGYGNLRAIQAGHWYQLGVIVNSESLQVYWDGKEILNQEGIRLYGVMNFFGVNDLQSDNAGSAMTMDIDNWRLWDLGASAWMRSDWIHASTPTLSIDNFSQGQGWQFTPTTNEKYQDGRAILFTNESETFLETNAIQARNFALEVTFTPNAFPDPASLVWTIGKNINGDSLEFEYFPIYGKWQINEVKDQQSSVVLSGLAQPIAKESEGTLMVLVDGNRVSAFQDDNFLGYAENDRTAAGTINALSVRSNGDLYTQVDIQHLRFWNLDAPEMMSPERISLRTPYFKEDNFQSGDGWQFTPADNEMYKDGQAVLYTYGAETSFTRNEIQGINFALKFSLISRNMSPVSLLVISLRKNPTTGDMFLLEYYPSNGLWQIVKVENHQLSKLDSGTTQGIGNDQAVEIMLVLDGDHLIVYLAGQILSSLESTLAGAGTWNDLMVRSTGIQPAEVDITELSYWDLGTPDWMRNDWINGRVPKFMDDNFQLKEDWQFNPVENVQFENGAMILFTNRGDINLTRSDFKGSNVAVEVTFIPQEMPEPAMLRWNMGMDETTNDQFSFEYSPATGYWMITECKNQNWNILQSGTTQTTKADQLARIMVVVNGNRMSAFIGDTFLGSVDFGYPAPGMNNSFGTNNEVSETTQIKITKIRFWNLDEPEWMSSYWVTSRAVTYTTDMFKSGDGWNFGPAENEKYEDNQLVLYTNGGETELTRNEINGENGALYVAFIPRTMPDTAALVWFMRENSTGGNLISFVYFPSTGYWAIFKVQNQVADKLTSGNTQTTDIDSINDIMVVMEGDRISAFQGATFLGSVESGLESGGTANFFIIRSPQDTFARVDLVKLAYWSLDK